MEPINIPENVTNLSETPKAAPVILAADLHGSKTKRKFPTKLFLLTIGLLAGIAVGVYFWLQAYSENTKLKSDLAEAGNISAELTRTKSELTNSMLKAFNQEIRTQKMAEEFRKTLTSSELDVATSDEVTYADINDDKIEDGLVTIHKTGSTKKIEVAVYTMKDGKLTQLFKVPVSDSLNQARSYIGPGKAITVSGTASSTATTTNTFYAYKWNGTTFAK